MSTLVIDPAARTPPYGQLVEQLTNQIRGGELEPGTRLPTVRRLASDLGVAPNTVARAVRELERRGLVQTRGRHGTVVAEPDAADAAGGQAARLAEEYAVRMGALGVRPETALRLTRRALGLGG